MPPRRPTVRRRGFSLVELLVVVALLGMLACLLAPSVVRARELGMSAVCRAQLAGLAAANALYAADNERFYVPAARDIFWGYAGNLHRWHGVRPSVGQPFDGRLSPLVKYLGSDKRIRRCPAFTEFRGPDGAIAYEAGSGGYGYSDLYVGSRFWKDGFYHNSPGQLSGARTDEVAHPGATVMFTDAAMPQGAGEHAGYVEESFCYCPLNLPSAGAPDSPASPRQPSIHFRHLRRANVAWVDGHVTERDDFWSVTGNAYGADPEAMNVGWFGPEDNSLFDLD